MPNTKRDLAFADDFIMAELVEDVQDFTVDDAVVVNLSPRPMITGTRHPAIVPAWKSTVLKGGVISKAERVALIKVRKVKNLGGAPLRGWDWLGSGCIDFAPTA